MDVDLSTIPMLARRAFEAELMQRIYAEATSRLGQEAALDLLGAAIDQAAREAGQAFAAKAPGGVPNLMHFAQVLDLWQAGGALSLADIRLGSDRLSFTVTRCGYMETYRGLGIPARLHATLSCRRDAAFAAGYSPHLRLERPQVISEGASACLFRFSWVA